MSMFNVTLFSVHSDISINTAPISEDQVKSLMNLTRDSALVDVHLPLVDGSIIVINKQAMEHLVFTYKVSEDVLESEE